MKNLKRCSSHLWVITDLPQEFVQLIEKDLSNFDSNLEPSTVHNNSLVKNIRNSKNTWIPSTHWIYGFIWSYVLRANRENFRYDLTSIDSESMQYTCYDEGDYYQWHTDDSIESHIALSSILSSSNATPSPNAINDYLSIQTEYVRKLSFSLMLSDADEYEGGNFQILDHKKTCFLPRKRGTLIIFDSRAPHRVLKVTKGQRKSLVGWCIGPRWR